MTSWRLNTETIRTCRCILGESMNDNKERNNTKARGEKEDMKRKILKREMERLSG